MTYTEETQAKMRDAVESMVEAHKKLYGARHMEWRHPWFLKCLAALEAAQAEETGNGT